MTIFITPTYHNKYVAYTLTNANDKIVFANVEYYSQIFNVPKNCQREHLQLVIHDHHANRLTLYNNFKKWCRTNNVQCDANAIDMLGKDKRVVQTSTGNIYKSPAECARQLNIPYDSLIKHLKAMPYHKSVKGEIYKYIVNI